MGLFDFGSKKKIAELERKIAEASTFTNGYYKPLFHISYDGEKNSGELGPIINYELDYQSLRYRSWESYLASEITQTVINKFVTWIIGSGLKLQSEPTKLVLESEGINVPDNFSKMVEARFKLFASSRLSDYTYINNIDRLARTVYINSIIGGDVLVIQRIKESNLCIQLVDGAHVRNPIFGDEVAKAEKRGNKVKNGIEQDKYGRHVAFFVQDKHGKSIRVEAVGKKTGRETAYLVYGSRYRIDDNRGMPLISTVLETLKKLDRYKEATVGSAEERAKIVYAIEHQEYSTGENPLAKTMAKALNVDDNQDVPIDQNNKQLADNIAASTQKQVFNMPLGASMKSLDTKNDIYFKDFYSVNVNAICAAIGIPPEVALSKYDSNFSASRAALKDWEHTINVERKQFSFQFYQKVYNTWLELDILKMKTQAPGYLTALGQKNFMVLEAYRNARFVGNNVPHIDPLKEVQAERLKLGDAAKHLPLTTAEASTELLGGGDFDTNLVQFGKEVQDTGANGVEDPNKQIVQPTNNDGENG